MTSVGSSLHFGAIADLGDGALPATLTTLATVRTGASVFVEAITLTNTGEGNRTCNIYLNRSGTRRRISPKDLIVRSGCMVTLNDGYSLLSGDTIDGQADLASSIDYSIHGVERKLV